MEDCPVLRTAFLSVFVLAALFAGSLLPIHSAAQIQNPIQAAKDAYKKAKQQAGQPQSGQPTSGQQQQTTKPQSTQQSQPQGGAAAPWTPPADDSASAAPVTLDPAKMPDIVGVHLGMTAQDALAVAKKTFPDDMYQGIPVNYWPSTEKPWYGYNLLSKAPGNFKDMSISFTAPPGTQIVWGMMRMTQKLHINKLTMIAALRDKYGKETVALNNGGGYTVVTSDAAIGRMMWLYDEKGARVPLPPSTAFPKSGNILECMGDSKLGSEPSMPKDDDWGRNYTDWCAHHFVAMFVTLAGGEDIIEYTNTYMIDVPLGIRTSHTAATWLRDVANQQHKEDLEKSKEKKPTL
jgi:hypothetical protein